MTDHDKRIARFDADFPGVWADGAEHVLGFGPGWDDLVWDVVRDIHRYLPEVRIWSLSAPWGYLSATSRPDQIPYRLGADGDGWVETLATASLRICEVCGQPGELVEEIIDKARVRCREHFNVWPDELHGAADLAVFLAERKTAVQVALEKACQRLEDYLSRETEDGTAKRAAEWSILVVGWALRDLAVETPRELGKLLHRVEHEHRDLQPEEVRQAARMALEAAKKVGKPCE